MKNSGTITTAKEISIAIRMGESSILMSGWLLEMSVRNLQNPLRVFAVLPLSSIAGAFLAVFGFVLLFFSKWILMLVGLYWLDGESLNLWPIFFFCVKVGAALPPVVIGCHSMYMFITMLVNGGGISASRKVRRMTFRDMPKDVVALEMPEKDLQRVQ